MKQPLLSGGKPNKQAKKAPPSLVQYVYDIVTGKNALGNSTNPIQTYKPHTQPTTCLPNEITFKI